MGRWTRVGAVVCVLFVCAAGLVAAHLDQEASGQEEQVQPARGGRKCSRDKARKARAVLDAYLFPFIDELRKGNMTKECIMQPARDMYRLQEQQKKEIRRSQWKCLFCQKVFRSEGYVDKHFDNRHSDALAEGAEVCLGDYCDVLHCDHAHPVAASRESSRHSSCKASVMARRRHHCEAIAHKCFPPEAGANTAHLNDFFVHQFCDAHTCAPGRLLFPNGTGKKSAFWNNAALFALVVGLGLLYTCVYFSHSDVPKGQDFQRRAKSARKKQSVLALLGFGGKKKKVY